MEKYYDFKLSTSNADFHFSSSPTIREREVHAYHEILFFEGKEATLFCEGTRREILNSTLCIFPKGTFHYFKFKENAPFERLKISLHNDKSFEKLFSCVLIAKRIPESVEFIKSRLIKAVEEKNERNANIFLSALLAELELSEIFTNSDEKPPSLTQKITEYISNNLSKSLSLNSLSLIFSISPSTLTHTFKCDLGVSVHEYVLQKRLTLAKRLIIEGNKPSEIFTDCGFSDYSSFYKAYVRYFNHSPSQKSKK